MKLADLLIEALRDEVEAMRPDLDSRRRMPEAHIFTVKYDLSGGIRDILIDERRRGRYRRGTEGQKAAS